MSNEKQINNSLELEEKVAVAVTFLLVGWFLWQFLGNKEVSLKLADTQPEILAESSSRVRLFKEQNTVEVDPVTSPSRSNFLSLTNNDTEVSITAPVIRVDKPELSQTQRSSTYIDASKNVASETTSSASPIKKAITPSSKEIVKDGSTPVILELVRPNAKEVVVAPTVAPTIAAKNISTQTALTIHPLSHDLSQGLLKLSGTGQPKSHLQLLLNGRKASNIVVDAKGVWQYETNLKPGEYSIQVLSFAEDEQGGVQSALTRVTMPELPTLDLSGRKDNPIPVENLSIDHSLGNNLPMPTETKPITPDTIKTNSLTKAGINSETKLNDRFYQVKYGDTLNKLSRHFKVSLHRLVRANNISDKDQIEVGQMLIIPGKK